MTSRYENSVDKGPEYISSNMATASAIVPLSMEAFNIPLKLYESVEDNPNLFGSSSDNLLQKKKGKLCKLYKITILLFAILTHNFFLNQLD